MVININKRTKLLFTVLFALVFVFTVATVFASAQTKPATYYIDECGSLDLVGQKIGSNAVWTVLTDEGGVGDDTRIVRSGSGESYLDFSGTNQNTIRITIYEKVLNGGVRPVYAKDNGWYSQSGDKQIDNLIFWIKGLSDSDFQHIDTSLVNVQISSGAYNGRWSIIALTYTNSTNIDKARVWFSNGIIDNNYQIGKVELYDNATYTPEALPANAGPSGEEKPDTYYNDACSSVSNSGQRTEVSGIGLVNTDQGNVGDNSRIVRSGTGESYLQYSAVNQNTIRIMVYEKVLKGGLRPEYVNDNGWYSQSGAKQVENLIFWIQGISNTGFEHIDTSLVDVEISKGVYGGRWSIIALTYTHNTDILNARLWLSNGITDENFQIGNVELYNNATYTPNDLPADADELAYYYADDFGMAQEQNGQRLQSQWSAVGFDTYDAHKIGDSSRAYKNGAGESYTHHSLKNQDTIRLTVYEQVLAGEARPYVTPIKFSVYNGSSWSVWEASGEESDFVAGRYNYPQRWARYTLTYTLSEPIEDGMIRVVFGSDQYQIGKLEIFNSEYVIEEPYTPSSPSDGKDFKFSGWISIADISSGTVKDSIEFERQIVQMYESGINTILPSIWGWDSVSDEVLLSYNLRLLDIGNKYGMKSYVYHPALVTALKANNSVQAESLMAPYKNHPAFLGLFVIDEPDMSQLEDLKTAATLFNQMLPDKTFYINLFPYERYNQRYVEYIDTYFNNITGTKYLSTDYYVLVGEEGSYSMKTNYLLNLQLLAQKAAEKNADLHTILLTMGHSNEDILLRHPVSTADLTFQAYAALAYGSKGITWFTYGPSGINPGMLDINGQKTDVYYMALEAAEQIQFFSDEFLQYSWTGTILHDTGVINPSFTAVKDSLKEISVLTGITSTQDLAIGTFSNGNSKALLLSNYTDPYLNLTAQTRLTFDRAYSVTVYLNGTKQIYNASALDVSLAAGEGAFITLTITAEWVQQYLKDEISAYAQNKIQTGNYSLRGKDFINTIAAELKSLLDGLTDQTEMQQAYDQAKLDIDQVKDSAAELTEVKTLYTEQLQDAYDAVDQSLLSADYVQAIKDMRDKLLAYFNVSTSGDNMVALLADFETLTESISANAIAEQLSAFIEVQGYMPSGTTEESYTENGIVSILGLKLKALAQIVAADNGFDTIAEGAKEQINNVSVSAQELADYRQEVIDAINNTKNSLNSSDYTNDNWTLIVGNFNSLLQQAENADGFAGLKVVMDSIEGAYKEVKTIAEQFNAYKQIKKTEISDFSNNKDYHNYSSAKWAEIVKIASDATTDIDAAQDIDAIDSIVASAKADINAVANLVQEFEEYKVNASAQARQYVQNLGENNYESIEWATINEILQQVLNDISTAENKAEITTIMEEGQQSISLVKNIVRQLADYKTLKIASVDEAFKALTKQNYTSGGWIKIQSAMSAAKTSINSANDKATVDAALEAFIAQIAAAETPEPVKPGNSCKALAGGAYTLIAAFAVAAAAIYCMRGRKYQNK